MKLKFVGEIELASDGVAELTALRLSRILVYEAGSLRLVLNDLEVVFGGVVVQLGNPLIWKFIAEGLRNKFRSEPSVSCTQSYCLFPGHLRPSFWWTGRNCFHPSSL